MNNAAPHRRVCIALVLTFIALAIAGNAFAAGPNYSATVLNDSPIAYWRLGELGGLTAADSGPYHYDAQYDGTSPAAGALFSDSGNGGANLTGPSKIVSAQDWSWLGGAPQGGAPNRAFSLEFWMKPAVIDSRYLWVISEEDKNPVRQGWGVMLTQQPGQPATLSYERWADGGYVGGVVYKNDSSKIAGAIGVGKWTHVVVTYDGATNFGGSNTIRLWIDGVLVNANVAQPANMVLITQRFRVGQGDDGASQPGFIGAIDEMAIYGSAIWTVPAHYRAAFVAPANATAPTVSGTAKLGQALTLSEGSWTGGPAPTMADQWQRCDSAGANCSDIAGATGSAYTVSDADAGSTLRASVTGTNPGGSATATTAVTTFVHGTTPASTGAPAVSGSGKVGEQLTATSGSWSGVPAPGTTFQWRRCNTSGTICNDLPGATVSTYTPTVSDVGSKLVVRVTATNSEGTATAVSTPVAVVASSPSDPPPAASAPVNVTVPAISGATVEGSTLTADTGTWNGSPTGYGYQWLRCAAGSCANVAGATGTTYTLGSADVNSGLAVVVTATNATGSTQATSATTATVTPVFHAPAAPAASSAPAIAGQPVDGATATADPGTWTGSPTSYAYQWRRCAAGGSCADVAGATGTTYALGATDVGSTLVVAVTATGAGGSATAVSGPFGPVTAAAPTATADPVVSGAAVDGGTLTASAGTWSGSGPLAYGYQWQRCDTSCAPVAGATGSTYALGASDVGSTLEVVVTATNGGGSATATSAPTAKVAAAAPVSASAPVVSGSPVDGETLSATTGSWNGTAPFTYGYQWRRCGSDGSCVDVAGATGASYVLGSADVGSSVAVVVTATNLGGNATAVSSAAGPVGAAAPTVVSAPSVDGTAVDGGTLTATNGGWNGTAPLAYGYQWQRCDTTCAPVSGATGGSYTPGAGDVGSTLQVVVTATNGGGSASATSAPTAKVAAAAPVSASAPVVSGSAVDGETLTATTGTWNGTAPFTYGYQWRRCAADGSCVDLSGATASSYVLRAADVGSSVAVVVTATNGGGKASAVSSAAGPVGAAAPTLVSAPSVDGTAVDGGTLTATNGGWNGTAPLAYGYQWQRCDTTCTSVAGATSSSYTLAAGDVGSTLQVVVTATNGGGSASATSTSTAKVAAAAPVSASAPVVTGSPVDRETLSATTGTWNGTAPLTYGYQWRRCGSDGSCVDVAGATGASYVLAGADVGSSVAVVVTATNGGGNATAVSAAAGPVTAAVPTVVAAPTVDGSPVDGGTLTATDGSWNGTAPLAYSYQWQRCNTACAPVAGATGSSYSLHAGDVGSTLEVVVTATNAGGGTSATSAPTAKVAAAAPVSLTTPVVSGSPVEGQTLSTNDASWSGTAPFSYGYQWRRCAADGSCIDIAGATGSSYVLRAADVGSSVAVVVTATNAGGSASAVSAARGPVTALAPAEVTAPVVDGSAVDGRTLTATTGTWDGVGPLTYAYQWQRCDTACAPVAGATSSSYTLGAGDVGSTLQVVVTATNAGGNTSATSAPTAKVAAAAPVATATPTVSGTALDGQTLSATTGTWNGTAPLAYGYQWRRCAADGSCVDIAGATGGSYVLRAADVGSSIAVVVTATNGGGSASAVSAAAGPVASAAPVATAAPTISGTPVDGQTLDATTGTWDGTGPFAYAYRWQRCDARGAACAPIAGATGSSYTLAHADAGSTIAVVVTASNAAAATSATSATVGPVAAVAPTNTTVPTIAGTLGIGQTLTASPGVWTGTPTFAYAYQWLTCGTTCQPIAGATAQTYTVRAADFASSLRVDVKATNAAGSATASSEQTQVVADTVAPTLTIATVATGGITIAGWNVSLLLTVGITAVDAESGLAADPTCTVDGRAATLKANGPGAWTVSVLNIGTHSVSCTVADKAGNRASASANVKPGGARELEQALLDQVNKLAATANVRDAAQLKKVAAKVSDALTPTNWLDSNHLQPKRGEVVFDDNKDAALTLLAMLKDKQTQVPQATLVGMLLTIVQVERVVVSAQIADALAARTHDQKKSDDAKQELNQGESSSSDGDNGNALDHWKNAWRSALQAVGKL